MTEEQMQKIICLRYKGWGYKKIANKLDVTRDAVRRYSIKIGLDGNAEELLKYQEKIVEEFNCKFCLYCGSEIVQNDRGRKKKYCSIDCKRNWEKEHPKVYKLICNYCGNEFESIGSNKQKYCNRDCYIRDRFWRDEDTTILIENILARKKVSKLPKWLKELLLSD